MVITNNVITNNISSNPYPRPYPRAREGDKMVIDSPTATLPTGAECQCIRCWLIFTSISGFDLHQYKDSCIYPKKIGMKEIDREGKKVWSMPGRDDPEVNQIWKLRKEVIEGEL